LPQGMVEKDEGVSGLAQWGFEVRVPRGSTPTVPYFLSLPLNGDLYDWSRADGEELGEPLQSPSATAEFNLLISGVPVGITREVVYRVRDQARGEVRLPIRALPEIEVSVTPSLLLWPAAKEEAREVEVLVRSHSKHPLAGTLELSSDPPLGQSLAAKEIRIEEPEGQQILRFELSNPTSNASNSIRLTATAKLDTGRSYAAAYPVVSYPHIRPLPQPVPARVEIQMLDLKLPEVTRVGYIRGAADRVPEILREIGLPLQMLTDADLGAADLSRFDAIVVGSRAYETRPTLAEVNSRLLKYVEEGGLLLVQYQQYQFVRGGFTPLALEIARPHGRVTDETAAIAVLQPEHAAFRTPNRITQADWSGWVQERGLYFASQWDPAFSTLLSLHDEGQPVEKGVLLVATVGKGLYVYTGLSFFRQLPAGVPGAIRLFVNLLSLERS